METKAEILSKLTSVIDFLMDEGQTEGDNYQKYMLLELADRLEEIKLEVDLVINP